MSIIIGKPIEGISLNGNEYLLDSGGNLIQFPDRESAMKYMKECFDEPVDDTFLEDNFVFEDYDENNVS